MDPNHAENTDPDWEQIRKGNLGQFEQVVREYQDAVTAIAFAGTGDLGGSEDIAQETFLAAWQQRAELRDPARLGGWLCGIARNLARQWQRTRAARSWAAVDREERSSDWVDLRPGPDQRVISEEEQQLVWRSLESIPEIYREVLVLYYRQSQSISEVSVLLGVSEEVIRQRLSRGRNLLRQEVARTVERTIEHSRPGPRFTAGVMAGLAGLQGVGKSLGAAAVGATAAKAATSSIGSAAGKALAGSALGPTAAGVAGAALGTGVGLAGAWLGVWLPAQLAPTMTERRLMEKYGRRLMIVTTVFVLSLLALILAGQFRGYSPGLTVATIVLPLVYSVVVFIGSLRLAAQVNELRRTLKPETDPNPSWLRNKAQAWGWDQPRPSRWVGRRGTSLVRLFGWPLWDFQVSDPVQRPGTPPGKPLPVARGWIAVGDRATGLLLAIGGRAMGTIALGGLSIGLISFGGLAIGLGFAVGGGAIGYQAIGGGAIGWNALGGAAVGIHSAGGLAIGLQHALGGLAISAGDAVGGKAIAGETAVDGRHMITAEGKEQWRAIRSAIPGARWMMPDRMEPGVQPDQFLWFLGFPMAVALPSIALPLVMYRRRSDAEFAAAAENQSTLR